MPACGVADERRRLVRGAAGAVDSAPKRISSLGSSTRGVLAHPGYFFDFPRESFLVVSLLPPERSFMLTAARAVLHAA